MIRAGQLVPHFEVADVTRGRVSYVEHIWQRRILVLLTIGSGAFKSGGISGTELDALRRRLLGHDAELVATRDHIDDVPAAGVVIADSWGEVAFVEEGPAASLVHEPSRILEWVQYLQHVCPECEGERK